MKILVTGSCGFIGFHVCSRLLQENHVVYGIDNMNDFNITQKQDNLVDLNVYKNFYFTGDNMGTTNIISTKNPDVIIHLGAYAGIKKSLEQPQLFINNNIEATCHLLQESVKNKTKLFLFASSSTVYGLNDAPFRETDTIDKINSIYAWTKKSIEDLCSIYHRLYKLNCIGMRLFTVYGPRGRPDLSPLKILSSILENKTIDCDSSKRDYTFIDDVVDGIIGLCYHYIDDVKFEIFNIGNNKTTSLNQVIKICETIVDRKAKINFIHKNNVNIDNITYPNIDKARRIIGYEPKITLFQGLRRTYTWIQVNTQKKNLNNVITI